MRDIIMAYEAELLRRLEYLRIVKAVRLRYIAFGNGDGMTLSLRFFGS
jgi:hypothetical protein